jgi:hypothetical protein
MNIAPTGPPTDANPFKGLRILAFVTAVLLSFPAGILFIDWLGDIVRRGSCDLMITSLASCLCAATWICWWFALHGRYASSRTRIFFTLLGALITGGVSFAIGFFGPIILTPDANQGPLLGIFYTGPLGFAAGALIGALIGWWRTREPNR